MLRGFQFNGIATGIKSKKVLDLGLIYSEVPAVAVGVFTTNKIKAAPVLISQHRISRNLAQAILVNSGNANACTGEKGLKGALELSRVLAQKIGVPEEQILLASTGIIGVQLPLERIKKGIPELVNGLSPLKIKRFARSILTTDAFPKIVKKKLILEDKIVRIWGVAKGAGMIMPHLATMLAFIMTDAVIQISLLKSLLKKGVAQSFNRITVDGEMSTNDMVIALANGMAGNRKITSTSPALKSFEDSFFTVLSELSLMIVRDGEGATKAIWLTIENAKSIDEARRAAFAVANSMLVKSSFFGEEANWGRIMAALGRCGISVDQNRIDISYGSLRVVKNGVSCNTEVKAKEVLKQKEFELKISLNKGKSRFRVLTTDLTPRYVEINSNYKS